MCGWMGLCAFFYRSVVCTLLSIHIDYTSNDEHVNEMAKKKLYKSNIITCDDRKRERVKEYTFSITE